MCTSFITVVLNRGYTYHLGVRGAKAGVRSTKVSRDWPTSQY